MSSDLVTRIRDALARGWLGEDDVAAIEALEGEVSEANNAHAKTLVEFGNLKLRAERLRVALTTIAETIDTFEGRGDYVSYVSFSLDISDMARKALEDDKQ